MQQKNVVAKEPKKIPAGKKASDYWAKPSTIISKEEGRPKMKYVKPKENEEQVDADSDVSMSYTSWTKLK